MTEKTYTVVMVGISGNQYRTECKTLQEAEALAANNRNLGWEASVEVEDKEPTVVLQFWGEQRAVEVQDLEPGMVTMWNGGYKKEIAGVVSSKSGKTHQIMYADGTIDHRKMRTGRLVAIA